MMNHIRTALLQGAACLLFLACNDSDDKKKLVELPRPEDKQAPVFLKAPALASATNESLMLRMSVDEYAEVWVALRPVAEGDEFPETPFERRSADSNSQLLRIQGKDSGEVQFYDLDPGTEYYVFLLARDALGNLQEKATIVRVKTLASLPELRFLNQPKKAYQGLLWQFVPQSEPAERQLHLMEAPDWLHFDAIDNLLSGIPPLAAYRERAFRFTFAIKEGGQQHEQSFEVPIEGDPLAEFQWHIENVGQSAFSWLTGKYGVDINLMPLIAKGANGMGARIRIVDTGLQVNHPDLQHAINLKDSKNFSKQPACAVTDDEGSSNASGTGGTAGDGQAPAEGNAAAASEQAPAEPANATTAENAGTTTGPTGAGAGSEGTTNASAVEDCPPWDPNNPSPSLAAGALGDRGTAIAGIIAAQAWNSIGGRGIAPAASISGYNLLIPEKMEAGSSTPNLLLVEAIKENPESGGVDIVQVGISNSNFEREANLGYSPTMDGSLRKAVDDYRQKKGLIVVKGAGDEYSIRAESNFDPLNATPWTIVVGAVNAFGIKSSNSNPGSNLWISAPGGEMGIQSELALMNEGEQKFPKDFFTPAMITTDLHSEEAPCQQGYSKRTNYFLDANVGFELPTRFFNLGQSSGFDIGWSPLNDRCDHTAVFNGTSAAAAVVSGVIALMLEKNPDLTWRDVRHILASTARKIDDDRSAIVSIDGVPHTNLMPWITNQAGFRFHNWYGFGMVDAAAAVAMAKTPQTYVPLPTGVVTSWAQMEVDKTIPANSAFGLSKIYTITDPEPLTLETVQIQVSIRHVNMSHFSIELISPNGTKSVLLPVDNGAYYENFSAMTFATNAFYGETVSEKGIWTLQVIDGKGGQTEGLLQSWNIRFLGHR